MKVVKIKDDYYGVIEDNDNIEVLKSYWITIYAIEDVPNTTTSKSPVVKYVDDMNRIVCSDHTVLLPEIDSFAVLFNVCPSVISEARFRFLCDEANINYKSLIGVTMDIQRVLNNRYFNTIKGEVDAAIENGGA